MDAATLANVKWLMTYINDSKASNIGQLFMAVQTYVWDHQSYKGEPVMAPEMRVVMPTRTPMTCIWASSTPCLRRRRGRMPNFSVRSQNMQREGTVASVIEDDAAKWAVFALSSNRKNQSFFNYYGPRELVVKDTPQGGDEPTSSRGRCGHYLDERWLPERPVGWTVQNSTSTVTARSSAAM